jgi:integrase
MLTGARLSEAAESSWGEFSQTEWTVPGARFKSGQVHIVPLTPAMKTLLASLPRWTGGDYLFSTTNGRLPVCGFNGNVKIRLDREMAKTWRALGRVVGTDRRGAVPENWTPHDLRRTVRTRLSALRVPENIAEMVIGHSKRGLARIYDQHRYADEIREALVAWNNLLESIVEPPASNIVPLRVVVS